MAKHPKRSLQNSKRKYQCEECGNEGVYNGKSLTLQVDHINGQRFDNRLENLRYLCPNCHSQTDTWCGRNRTRSLWYKEFDKLSDNLLTEILSTKTYDEWCKEFNIRTPTMWRYLKKRGLSKPPVPRKSVTNINCKTGKAKSPEEIAKELPANRSPGYCVLDRNRHRKVVWPSDIELQELINTLPVSKIAKRFGVSDNAIRKWCNQYNLDFSKMPFRKHGTRKPKCR